MAPDNRPKGRQKTITQGKASVQKKGPGLGTGPVGTGSGGGFSHGSLGGPQRSGGGGRGRLFMIIAVVVLVILTGGLKGLFGGGSSGGTTDSGAQTSVDPQNGVSSGAGDSGAVSAESTGISSLGSLAQLFGAGSLSQYYAGNSSNPTGQAAGGLFQSYAGSGSVSTVGDTSYKSLNTEVDKRAREKRTVIKGGGQDTVTIMVYMCGTDLESKHGMATSDMMEMAGAELSDNVNLLLYTGGCLKWQNNVVNNSVNQIYKVQSGGVKCLEKDMGDKPMTSPDTLKEYIEYCAKNYPADRYELIFWDHGGGTISGYGYDEKKKNGSMTLGGIDKALKESGVIFDFIGFDACLMATLENGLMLSQYGDYMIASEETEPGVGWYYTNWLTKLSKDTSMPTIEIGKNIIDDFVDVCAKKCQGQKTTLSIVDLAELEKTIPEELTSFAKATSELIKNDEYKVVSDARYSSREFAQSSKIDQVDLVDFAEKIGTDESESLAETIKSAVKYNKTSRSMSNAYGLSAYFPMKKMSKVDQAASVYDDIGMDSEYTSCIKDFASLQLGGQTASSQSGMAGSPLPSLLGTLLGTSQTSSSSQSGASTMINLFGSMLSGNLGGLSGLASSNTGFLSDRSFDDKKAQSYVENNMLDPMALLWTMDSDGKYKLELTEEQWSLVHGLDLNVFYDDGEGYIDLGLDNIIEYDDKGNLIGEYDNTWLTLNGSTIAYYHTDTVEGDDGSLTVTGYVPAFLNGEKVKLIIVFDDANPEGYVAGAETDYDDRDTDTIAKNMIALKDGDELQFICDYYSYEGEYKDSYYLGDPVTLSMEEGINIANMDIGKSTRAVYKLTDIYEQSYWTQVIPE
ncbi:MAG: peptidase C11 [Lachnospiraceae bacterium]|nr:peptidase C11 [Lachnospiraceae bacterium]